MKGNKERGEMKEMIGRSREERKGRSRKGRRERRLKKGTLAEVRGKYTS